MSQHTFVATTSRGTEPALVMELEGMGLQTRSDRGAVHFRGSLKDGYRVLLWSRVASRVLLTVGQGPARSAKALYDTAHAIRWHDHIHPSRTMAVHFVGRSEALRDSRYGAMVVKDAVVDQIRHKAGSRPDIDLKDPDVRVHAHLQDGEATLSIDLSGDPLHQRGHGRRGGVAPLKENLAAALLLMADWPMLAEQGTPLLDPMCGSGTLLEEAVGIALGRAPSRDRTRWGVLGWHGHDTSLWNKLRRACDRPDGTCPPVFGSDKDGRAVGVSADNLQRAGLREHVQLTTAALADRSVPKGLEARPRGLVVVNPPYGERMEDEAGAARILRDLGDVLRQRYLGWRAWVLAGSPKLARQIGLKPARKLEIFNGPIEVRWVQLNIRDQAADGPPKWRKD
jgi:23S rRNA (guanine2445-N2)-methyltransferase / 23S rRNA (guanine2069-N7)-methyltransferase